ncbi:hypothetical protein HYS72_01390 [Candidatus Pacearchaeota archaeon]|nr:hypothetical protein [Candidatus Pacearchaeota archaeon]MBI2056989.1 hypothetical protein [Candidatus Pacearchaeota archaeon]
MVDLEIPATENGVVNFYKLEFDLERCFSNDPENTRVNLIGNNKYLLKELRNNLQSSFDYKIIKVGKKSNNYLIEIGVKI